MKQFFLNIPKYIIFIPVVVLAVVGISIYCIGGLLLAILNLGKEK